MDSECYIKEQSEKLPIAQVKCLYISLSLFPLGRYKLSINLRHVSTSYGFPERISRRVFLLLAA